MQKICAVDLLPLFIPLIQELVLIFRLRDLALLKIFLMVAMWIQAHTALIWDLAILVIFLILIESELANEEVNE
jgi:hypothetical protein